LLTVGYAEKDAHDIPTGVIVPLRTPFRYCPRTAGKTSQIDNAVDHHFFAQQNTQELNLTCIARSPQSGISLLVSSTKAGFQLYSGHFLTPPLSPYAGFCVEPQYAPNAINIAEFYSPLTTPESPYKHTIIYALSNS
jgi:aldose 1-epimerase